MTSEFLEQIKKDLDPNVLQRIKDGTLNFLKENNNHLPMYHIPTKN